MRATLAFLTALLWATPTLAGKALVAPPTDSRLLLNDVALNAAAGSRTFEWAGVLGYETVVFLIDYTHANNGTLTLTCTVSDDANTTDYKPTTCEVSSGTCAVKTGGVFVTDSLSASLKYAVRMGIRGYKDLQCVIAHGGSPNASDTVTINGYVVAP